MANGMYHQLSASPHSMLSLEDQKAFGILIETLDPSQYRYNQHPTQVRTAYEALVIQHEPTSKIDRIQVAMEWIRLSWDVRQEPCRISSITSKHSSNDYTTDFRHIVDRRSHLPESDQTVKENKVALETEWKAAVRNGAIKLPRAHSNHEGAFLSKEDVAVVGAVLEDEAVTEDTPAIANCREIKTEPKLAAATTVDMQNNIENVPEVLGEPEEPTEVNDPTWSAHTRPRRTINLNGMRYECTFMSRTEFDFKSEGDEAMVAHDHGSNSIAQRIIVDSDASARMIGASKQLYHRKKFHRQVVVANGGVTVATTLGKLNIITPNTTVLTLTDVLLVDGMTSTL
ncbi:hypothetical protein DYB32_009874 [Aphanomyces invadans]|uniref:Uncharacterized protein n=1 Tax=Aphanomyces invadans TaxID=157072 RepID=A0A3R6VPZ7_9STRA|nr:hypothetical protein DYB32_009874 [Aphanomyces invadans]